MKLSVTFIQLWVLGIKYYSLYFLICFNYLKLLIRRKKHQHVKLMYRFIP